KPIESKGAVNDPLFSDQASLHQANDQDLDAPEAWDISTGSKAVVVGVIDTGIDYTHPDLTSNMWTNPDEIPNDGIDNDNNGYIDDIHGIDTWYGDSDPIDGNDHGTNVAGIIGAVGNNNKGLAGINHAVTLVACKAFSDDRGGSTSSIYECMNYLLSLKRNKGLNIRVINNSYSQEKDPAQDADDILVWEMMVEKFAEEDVLFVVAASNDFADNDVITQMPGNLPNNNVITVASTMHNGRFAYSHSNYGRNTVHIGAPGVAITSTESLIQNAEQPYYPLLQGTSFAAPHVAGAAALALSINPDLTAVALKKLLMETGDKLASLEDKTVSGKRVNLHKMLIAADPAQHLAFEANEQVRGQSEIIKGQSNTIVFDLVSKNGFVNSASLSVVTPSGITASLSKATGQAGQTVSLIVTADENMPLGDHTITLVASGYEQSLNVEVLPGELNTVSLTAQTLELTSWLPDGVSSSVDLTSSDPSETLVTYDVKVTMDINHEKVGELDLYLVSPSGTKVNVLSSDGIWHMHRDIREVFYNFRGEAAQGSWTLQVYDNAGGPWEDLDKIVGSIDWTLDVQVAGGTTIEPPLTCDQDPTQSQCIQSCEIDSTQAHCAVLCESANAPDYDFCQSGTTDPVILLDESNLSSNTQIVREVTVPAGKTLSITADGGTGDADLLVKFGQLPVLWNKDCYSGSTTNNEACTITNTRPGTYFIVLDSAEAFVGVTLKASYQ
ncbi:MAG: S8 family serine peptidase, partial [Algicola sp.]|nr:S8 family serine peptidase [Algicola sp.]